MKFIISSESLVKNLQVLGSILNNNNTLPILDCFLFEIINNNLHITASDMETSLTSNISIESSIQSNIAIPAKLLIDIVRSLPDQPLTFSVLENNILEINSSNGQYSLSYYDGSDFPKPLAVEEASVINFKSVSYTHLTLPTICSV